MPNLSTTPGHRIFWRIAGTVIGAWALIVVGVFGYEAVTLRASRDDARPGDRPSDPFLRFHMDGIVRPSIVEADASGLRPDEEVIGVEVAGQFRAYRLDAFRDRSHHLVNDLIGEVPVSVSYCDLGDCVRAYTEPGQSEPLEVSVGGLFDGVGMVLEVGGHLYFQNTGEPLKPGEGPAALPLQRLSTERTTWERWRKDHPSTGLYVGDR